jgi:hypothetical protein
VRRRSIGSMKKGFDFNFHWRAAGFPPTRFEFTPQVKEITASLQSNGEGETMSETSTLIGYQGRTISREELALVQTPAATSMHVPVPHHEIVQALVETLGFRHIRVAADEYAVSPDAMKMFGVVDLETEMHGCRFAISVENSHDRSMRLALTCGCRVFVARTWLSTVISNLSWPNTRRAFRWWTPSRSVLTGCSGTSSPCDSR